MSPRSRPTPLASSLGDYTIQLAYCTTLLLWHTNRAMKANILPLIHYRLGMCTTEYKDVPVSNQQRFDNELINYNWTRFMYRLRRRVPTPGHPVSPLVSVSNVQLFVGVVNPLPLLSRMRGAYMLIAFHFSVGFFLSTIHLSPSRLSLDRSPATLHYTCQTLSTQLKVYVQVLTSVCIRILEPCNLGLREVYLMF